LQEVWVLLLAVSWAMSLARHKANAKLMGPEMRAIMATMGAISVGVQVVTLVVVQVAILAGVATSVEAEILAGEGETAETSSF
jgi:hypothetical protein